MKIADLVGPPSSLLHYTGGCSTCPLRRIDYVPATLNTDASFITVGEGPGRREAEEGEGFIGDSGQLIRAMYRQERLEPFAFSNVVHCRPPDNRDPRAKEISCCMAMLTMQEVRGYPVVVLAGSIAQHAFFPGVRTEKLLGNFAVHPDYPGQRFYSIYHPAYVLPGRREDLKPRLEELIRRLGRYLRGERPQIDLVTPDDLEQFNRVLPEVLNSKRLGIDVETNGKPTWSGEFRIRSYCFSADAKTVIGVHEDHPAFLGVLGALAKWLHDPKHIPVGHNLGVDIDFIEHEMKSVCRCKIQVDTMALAYQALVGTEVGLKQFVSDKLDGYANLVVDPVTEQEGSTLLEYNAEDAVYPLQLADKFLPMLPATTRDLFIRVAGRQSTLYNRIQSDGVYLRTDVWEELKAKNAAAIEANFKAWQAADPRFPGPTLRKDSKTGFKVYSLPDKVLSEYLFATLGLPVLKQTKRGPAMDDHTIHRLLDEHNAPQLQYLREHRKLDKERSTYIDPMPGLISTDGRVHPRYVYDTTDTGRRSCREPNYQNPPRTEIRRMWGAEKGIFLEADFSQIELRIAVSLANSLPAIEKYRQGIDLHTQMAQAFIGPGVKPTKEQRTRAKSVNFALIYGGGWRQLQRQAWEDYGVRFTDAEAQHLHRLFFTQVVPGLDQWHRNCIQEMQMNQGYSVQVTGHQHIYKNWDHAAEEIRIHEQNSYINGRCQGPAAYIACHTMIGTQQAIREQDVPARVVGDVHDAVHVEVREKQKLDQVRDIVQMAVRDTASWISGWFKVPLIIDFKAGPSWWEAKDL